MITLTSTRILISVQVMADDSAAADLLYLLAFVTSILPTLASAARFVSYVAGWVSDITAAVVFTGKVTLIILASLSFAFCGGGRV